MSVYAAVRDALEGEPDGWRTRLALRIALDLDERPNAANARELRQLMAEVEAGHEPVEEGVEDELRARRENRVAKAE